VTSEPRSGVLGMLAAVWDRRLAALKHAAETAERDS
jgi:hypothetical protein